MTTQERKHNLEQIKLATKNVSNNPTVSSIMLLLSSLQIAKKTYLRGF